MSGILNNVRTLLPDEIECRIGNVAKTGKGASLLLYKNGRVDMALLDELVGTMNWQRDHKELKGVIYCGVGIRDEQRGEWVWKWDAGTESNAEPQKGEASDSFKRACVNWGIGRELYTAPFIWVEFTERESGNRIPKNYFRVSAISYDDRRRIVSLSIVDESGNVRYTMGAKAKRPVRSVANAQTGAQTPKPTASTAAPLNASKMPAFEGEYAKKIIVAYCHGKPAKDGRDLRTWYIESYGPTQEQLDRFDGNVFDYCMDQNIKVPAIPGNNQTRQ